MIVVLKAPLLTEGYCKDTHCPRQNRQLLPKKEQDKHQDKQKRLYLFECKSGSFRKHFFQSMTSRNGSWHWGEKAYSGILPGR